MKLVSQFGVFIIEFYIIPFRAKIKTYGLSLFCNEVGNRTKAKAVILM